MKQVADFHGQFALYWVCLDLVSSSLRQKLEGDSPDAILLEPMLKSSSSTIFALKSPQKIGVFLKCLMMALAYSFPAKRKPTCPITE